MTEIAIAAKSHWGYPARWLETWRELLTITPEYIVAHDVHVARADRRIAGFSGLERERTTLLLQHLWVWPAYMGRGVGQMLFHHARRRAGALGFSQFEIEADPNAAGFYERMGARLIRTNVSWIEDQPRNLPVFVCYSPPSLVHNM